MNGRFRLLGAVLALALVGAAPAVPYTLHLGPVGDPALATALADSSELRALRRTAPVGPFALLARARGDLTRFHTVLAAFGYYQGRAVIRIDGMTLDAPGLLARLDAARSPARVSVRFHPGRLFRLGRVRIAGAVPLAARKALGLHPGEPARAGAVLDAEARLLAALRAEGHALARVSLPPAILHAASARMDVTFRAVPGPVLRIGPLRFTGLRGLRPGFLRRRLAGYSGQVLTPARVAAMRAQLLDLPILSYARAELGTAPDAAGRLPLTFALGERARHVLDAGLDYSTDIGLGVTAGWHDRDLFGKARQLDLTGAMQGGGNAEIQPGYRLAARYRAPDGSAVGRTLELDAGAVHQVLIPYTQTAVTEAVRVDRRLSAHWAASLGLAGEQETISQQGVSRVYYLVRLPFWLRFDDANSALNPTYGARFALLLAPTQSLLGHTSVLMTEASGAIYLDLEGAGRGVLALRGLFGAALGARSAFTLPPDQRFYAGGSATVRGYRFQSLGPQFPDGQPIGGTEIATLGAEFRQRIGRAWGFSVFADTGAVTAGGAPRFGVGIGAGLAYYTSIGPIRAQVAVPAVRMPGSGAFELYLGVGQAF
ncbi:MAG: autotransporter assembly complex protein TamA [Acetobacteraceae bacterium]